MLSTTLPDPRQQAQFLTQYMNHEGCIENFWSCLSDSSEFKHHVEDLQFTLQLGTLTGNHLPLIEELQRIRKENEITSLRDLAKFNEEDWLKLITKQIDGQTIGFPPYVPGKDDSEKSVNYAKAIKKISRLYKISPSNESLDVLLKKGFDSAQDIMSRDTFAMMRKHQCPSCRSGCFNEVLENAIASFIHNLQTFD